MIAAFGCFWASLFLLHFRGASWWGQCDGDCPLPPTPKDDPPAAGGTTGLLMMAILFPGSAIYFGAGAYRNWKAGEQQFM